MKDLQEAIATLKSTILKRRFTDTTDRVRNAIENQAGPIVTDLRALLEALYSCPVEELTESILIDINYQLSKIA